MGNGWCKLSLFSFEGEWEETNSLRSIVTLVIDSDPLALAPPSSCFQKHICTCATAQNALGTFTEMGYKVGPRLRESWPPGSLWQQGANSRNLGLTLYISSVLGLGRRKQGGSCKLLLSYSDNL